MRARGPSDPTEAFSISAGLIRASYLERAFRLESRICNDKSPIRPWGQLNISLGEKGTAPQLSTHEQRLVAHSLRFP
jgi:hypothetical protein